MEDCWWTNAVLRCQTTMTTQSPERHMTHFMSIRYEETIMDHRLRQCVLIKMPCTAAVVWSAHVALPRRTVFPAGMSWQLQNLAEERD